MVILERGGEMKKEKRLRLFTEGNRVGKIPYGLIKVLQEIYDEENKLRSEVLKKIHGR